MKFHEEPGGSEETLSGEEITQEQWEIQEKARKKLEKRKEEEFEGETEEFDEEDIKEAKRKSVAF
ncbi:hypothetical protein HZA33_00800 [Candidatus Pacearchaeota archaeon]|nr:hypothetical protein [Candidatus Pacearchaeota archaeon]